MDGIVSTTLVNSTIVFITGLVLRIWLIHAYPIVFGGDSVLRLANRDHIFLSYQLPLLQVLIYGVSLISPNLLIVRFLMALIGAAAGLGFYWLIRCFVSERTGVIAALLFTANPFLVEISIVPFQELLMLAGLLFAFAYFFRDKWVAASGSLGLACLTRYEAWIAGPVLAIARGRV
jgi:4-amino-4-deoxy-L-arabinose transferase-like glycosyltransferase